MSKKLVTYFSASGSTAIAAKKLAKITGAELYEIKPALPYSDDDLNWKNKQSRSSVEMSDLTYRPAIADKNAGIDSYDVVFVGFPIWWYIAPTIINTFLESYDFSGKVIVPFATSGGSGFGETVKKLMPSASPTAIWKEPKLLNNETDQAQITEWINSLDL